MFRYPIQLTIPEPCGHRWDAMTPVPGGRHCDSCRKTVVDFTGMTDAEIRRTIDQHSGNMCGRLDPQQMNHTLIPDDASRHWPRMAATRAIAVSTAAVAPMTRAQVSMPTIPAYGLSPATISERIFSRFRRIFC